VFGGKLALLSLQEKADFAQQLRQAIVAGSGGAIVMAEILSLSLKAGSIVATASLAASVTHAHAATSVAALKAKQDANQALVVLGSRSFFYSSVAVTAKYECASQCSSSLEQGECNPSTGECECIAGFTGADCSSNVPAAVVTEPSVRCVRIALPGHTYCSKMQQYPRLPRMCQIQYY